MAEIDEELAALRDRMDEIESRLDARQDESDGSIVHVVKVVAKPGDATYVRYEIVRLSGSEAPGTVPTVTGTGAYLYEPWYPKPSSVAIDDLIVAASTPDGRWAFVGRSL